MRWCSRNSVPQLGRGRVGLSAASLTALLSLYLLTYLLAFTSPPLLVSSAPVGRALGSGDDPTPGSEGGGPSKPQRVEGRVRRGAAAAGRANRRGGGALRPHRRRQRAHCRRLHRRPDPIALTGAGSSSIRAGAYVGPVGGGRQDHDPPRRHANLPAPRRLENKAPFWAARARRRRPTMVKSGRQVPRKKPFPAPPADL